MKLFAKPVEGGTELYVTCYRCLHSDNNEGAMYFSTKTWEFICFRCGWKGHITSLDSDEKKFYEDLFSENDIDVGVLLTPDAAFRPTNVSFGKFTIDINNLELDTTKAEGGNSSELTSYDKFLARTKILSDINRMNILYSKLYERVNDKKVARYLTFVLNDMDYILSGKWNNQEVLMFLGDGMLQLYFKKSNGKSVYLTGKKNVSSIEYTIPKIETPVVVLTEGVFDAIAMSLLFDNKNVGFYATTGWSKTRRIYNSLKNYYEVFVIPDKDKLDEVRRRFSVFPYVFSDLLPHFEEYGVKDAWDVLIIKLKEQLNKNK